MKYVIGYLLLVICLISIVSPVRAQTVEERLREINEKLERIRRVLEPEVPDTGHGGGPTFTYAMPALSSVNNYLANQGSFSRLGSAWIWGGTYRYAPTRNFQIGFYGGGGVVGVTGKLTGDTYITSADIGMGVFAFVAQYKHILNENWAVYTGIMPGLYLAGLTIDKGYRSTTQSRDVDSWFGSNFGYQIYFGGQYRVDPVFAFGVDVSYTSALIPSANLAPQAGTESTAVAPDIDLSGISIRFGPQFHF